MTAESKGTIQSLRERVHRYPLESHPVEHATVQFNLGLALAEAPDGNRDKNLKAAIGAYARALGVFDSEQFPVQRARVLTALGSVERDLGMPLVARDRFIQAAACLDNIEAPAEIGSAHNNLGLARADLGEFSEAIEAYDRALIAFADESYSRQRATTYVNRGLAAASIGSVEFLESAVVDYEKALATIGVSEAPYVYALAHHSRAVALMGIPTGRERNLAGAIRSLEEALSVFTRSAYPFQHALARHNLGLAFFEIAPEDPTSLRRALAFLEEASSVLDPRLHREQWTEISAGVHKAEEALSRLGMDHSRVEHFVALIAAVSPVERLELMRYRLRWILALVEPFRAEALAALDDALVHLPPDQLVEVSKGWIKVLMEQPHDQLEAGLRSRQLAQARLQGAVLQAALLGTEAALGELEIIQRVRVRDILTDLGYERPDLE